jgi:23S rRNA pseudouridine2605 synthase
MEEYRVQKLLSNYGYCSRRKAEVLIQEGRVKVNNRLITIGDKAKLTDKISVDDKPVSVDKKRYLMFHKPIGCVTALTDDKYNTIKDFINIKERVFPIGRLDFNTSGLLLLTNDGDFANKVMHPRYEVTKTYLAGVDDDINDKDIAEIEGGVDLEDGKTAPAKVKQVNSNTIEITIHEGKNRIIRRMLKELGFRVRFLHRIRIGNLTLANLEKGKYKPLTPATMKKIFEKD